jgi:DNA-binding GntR family transcriptional regulator
MKKLAGMPLNLQIRERMHNRILSGEWAPGAAIPSEHELAAEYGVSRQTIRESIRALRYEGFLQSRRGSGTYVRLQLSSDPLVFTQDLLLDGGPTHESWSTRQLRQWSGKIGEAEEGLLRVQIGNPVLLTESLRLRNDSPFALVYGFRLVKDQDSDVQAESSVTVARAIISATVLHPYEARILLETAHSAALQLEILSCGSDGSETELHRCIIPTGDMQIAWPFTSADTANIAAVFGL